MSSNKLEKLSIEDAESWDFPFVESERPVEEGKTNAFNKRSDWRYEPPEPEEEILPPTAEEIEQIRQAAYQEGFESGQKDGTEKGLAEGLEQGHKDGYEAGLAQGLEEGLQNGQAEIEALATQWQALVNDIHEPLLKTHSETQKQLVLLAVSLAKAVIRTEVETQTEVIQTALKEAIATLPLNERNIQIKLHPDDVALITDVFGQEHIQKQQWQLISAPEMSRGGCDIMTDNNAVDHSIERRSRDVLDTFLMQQGLQDGPN